MADNKSLVIDPSWSVYSAAVNTVLLAAEQFGAKRDELLSRAAIAPSILDIAENTIPIEKYFRLFALAEDAIKNPDIGLVAGRISYLSGLNLQLYMTTICHTFRDYLNRIPSTIKLWGDVGEVHIRPDGDYIRLEWCPLMPSTGNTRYMSDAILAASAGIVDGLCYLPVQVRRACFTYAKPANITQLCETFGPNLNFDAEVSCLYLDRACLDYPLVVQNYKVQHGAAIPFSNLFDGKNPSDKFWPRLHQAIVRRLPDGELKIESVASDMNISSRTLQRRLAERNSHFTAEIKKIRAELAVRYLEDETLSITDVAFLLGFNDQGAFSNAFKQWHGISPRNYQQAVIIGI
jgi:AraC-like DNA-binding protein